MCEGSPNKAVLNSESTWLEAGGILSLRWREVFGWRKVFSFHAAKATTLLPGLNKLNLLPRQGFPRYLMTPRYKGWAQWRGPKWGKVCTVTDIGMKTALCSLPPTTCPLGCDSSPWAQSWLQRDAPGSNLTSAPCKPRLPPFHARHRSRHDNRACFTAVRMMK